MLLVVIAAVVGAAVAAVLACIPGLHIYNVMALLVLLAHAGAAQGSPFPVELTMPLMVAMIVGWSLGSTIPSVLLAAPDESALFTVLPGQKYLMRGRGHAAVMITSAGGLAALFLLILLFGPLAPRLIPFAHTVLRPHAHWVLWTVICFLLMSEWPKGNRLGMGGWGTFLDGWKTTGPGLMTFLLAGLLGFVLIYRTPIAPQAAFQNLMPAFVGLFTLPWLLVNLVSAVTVPPQRLDAIGVRPAHVLQGAFAGTLGGAFAAFFPVVTGGVGGLLAGHATALRDDRIFLASQGASRMTYYAGGLLLFFVPGVDVVRGGSAWLLNGLVAPRGFYEYGMALAATGISGAVAFLMLDPLTRGTLWLIGRCGYRRLSAAALVAAIALVLLMTGVHGLLVLLPATGIGLLPVLLGSRRMNCLGVILLPMACNMSGVGPPVAKWLGLL